MRVGEGRVVGVSPAGWRGGALDKIAKRCVANRYVVFCVFFRWRRCAGPRFWRFAGEEGWFCGVARRWVRKKVFGVYYWNTDVIRLSDEFF